MEVENSYQSIYSNVSVNYLRYELYIGQFGDLLRIYANIFRTTKQKLDKYTARSPLDDRIYDRKPEKLLATDKETYCLDAVPSPAISSKDSHFRFGTAREGSFNVHLNLYF